MRTHIGPTSPITLRDPGLTESLSLPSSFRETTGFSPSHSLFHDDVSSTVPRGSGYCNDQRTNPSAIRCEKSLQEPTSIYSNTAILQNYCSTTSPWSQLNSRSGHGQQNTTRSIPISSPGSRRQYNSVLRLTPSEEDYLDSLSNKAELRKSAGMAYSYNENGLTAPLTYNRPKNQRPAARISQEPRHLPSALKIERHVHFSGSTFGGSTSTSIQDPQHRTRSPPKSTSQQAHPGSRQLKYPQAPRQSGHKTVQQVRFQEPNYTHDKGPSMRPEYHRGRPYFPALSDQSSLRTQPWSHHSPLPREPRVKPERIPKSPTSVRNQRVREAQVVEQSPTSRIETRCVRAFSPDPIAPGPSPNSPSMSSMDGSTCVSSESSSMDETRGDSADSNDSLASSPTSEDVEYTILKGSAWPGAYPHYGDEDDRQYMESEYYNKHHLEDINTPLSYLEPILIPTRSAENTRNYEYTKDYNTESGLVNLSTYSPYTSNSHPTLSSSPQYSQPAYHYSSPPSPTANPTPAIPISPQTHHTLSNLISTVPLSYQGYTFTTTLIHHTNTLVTFLNNSIPASALYLYPNTMVFPKMCADGNFPTDFNKPCGLGELWARSDDDALKRVAREYGLDTTGMSERGEKWNGVMEFIGAVGGMVDLLYLGNWKR